MKKLYSSDDAFLLQSLRSELERLGIPYLVKNEFAGGAMGELPWHELQRELWLIDESWWPRAKGILNDWLALSSETAQQNAEWTCLKCGEINGVAFEVCWQCCTPHPHAEADDSV